MNQIRFFAMALLALFTMNSCSKNYHYNITVENVTVQLDAKEMITSVTKPFSKLSSINTLAATEVEHIVPTSYTAIFVSEEHKGQYTKGDIIARINVEKGGNTITVPKLKYKVIVSNYEFTDSQLSNERGLIKHLPKSVDNLLLLGEADIDYSVETVGTVEVTNPYAAVLILNNQWIKSAPMHYDNGSKKYLLRNGWYVLYIRDGETGVGINTGVPVNDKMKTYTMKNKVKANNVYEYVFNGVGNIDGNLIVEVEDILKVTHKEIINLY